MEELKDLMKVIMSIPAINRMSVILTALDYTMDELDLTYDDLKTLRESVDAVVGPVGGN